MTTILSLDDDIAPFLDLDCTGPERKLVLNLRKWVESQARAFVGHTITQETITNEYQRRSDVGGCGNIGLSALEGDRGYFNEFPNNYEQYLLLDNGFVRSVTEVREDQSARFGQGASDFPTSTVLTPGTQYYLQLDQDGLGKAGILVRNNSRWSSRPGTIRISYVSGFTAAELDGEYSFVKLALLEDLQTKYNIARSQRSSGGGPVRKEKWTGDYEVEYAVDTASRSLWQLSPGARSKLEPIKRIAL